MKANRGLLSFLLKRFSATNGSDRVGGIGARGVGRDVHLPIGSNCRPGGLLLLRLAAHDKASRNASAATASRRNTIAKPSE